MKTVSLKYVIARIADDYGMVGSDWITSSFEWIPQAIGKLRTSIPYEPTHLDVDVVDFKAYLPCDIQDLHFVTFEDKWLPIKRNGVRLEKCCSTNYAEHHFHFAVMNPDFLQTSFQEGTVRFYYLGLPLDDEGFPKVIDNEYYLEAISNYVVFKAILKGYKHQSGMTWQEAEARWIASVPKARNNIKYPSISTAEKILKDFNNLTKGSSLIMKFINER